MPSRPTKTSTTRATPRKPKRAASKASRAAVKGWQTRRAKEREALRLEAERQARREARRLERQRAKERARQAASRAAAKGWQTRRAHELHRAQAALERSRAAKRGALTRLRKDRAREALSSLVGADKDTRGLPFAERSRVKKAVHASWRTAKGDLYEHMGAWDNEAYAQFLEVLEGIADDAGCEWDIYYAGEGGE